MNHFRKNATCLNYEGGYNCTCNEGYEGDGFECSNICAKEKACGPQAQCRKMNQTLSQSTQGTNFINLTAFTFIIVLVTVDGHACQCDVGYSGDGFMCNDVDECLALKSLCKGR